MAENLIISGGDKASKYATLYRQLEALSESESDLIANMANFNDTRDIRIPLDRILPCNRR